MIVKLFLLLLDTEKFLRGSMGAIFRLLLQALGRRLSFRQRLLRSDLSRFDPSWRCHTLVSCSHSSNRASRVLVRQERAVETCRGSCAGTIDHDSNLVLFLGLLLLLLIFGVDHTPFDIVLIIHTNMVIALALINLEAFAVTCTAVVLLKVLLDRAKDAVKGVTCQREKLGVRTSRAPH